MIASRKSRFARRWLTLFSLVVSLTIAGCGGGTTGTGGTGTSQFEGKVLEQSGAPVADASVTIEETGDSTLTDATGSFALELPADTSAFTLRVETGAEDLTTTLDQIPPGPQKIEVEIEVDRTAKTAKVKNKKVTPKPTPTPAPPSSPPPSPTPTPVETSGDKPSTEQSPTPPPSTPAPTPSPTESATPAPTPDSSPTLAPTPTLRTLFTGVVSTSDPNLLVDAKIGVVGGAFHQIATDGTFLFRVISSDSIDILAVRSGGQAARLRLDSVTSQTRRVNLQLQLERRVNGNLKLTANSIEIFDRKTSDPNSREEEN